MKGHDETTAERPARAASRVSVDASGEPVIALSAAVQQSNGIETVALHPAPFQEEIRGYGTVLDLVGLAALGNDYGKATAQLQIAQARLDASKAAFARAQTLYRNQQNISKAELQTTEAAFRADQAGLSVAASQLQTVAATAMQEWGPVLGKALANGDPLATRLLARQEFLIAITLPPGVSLRQPPPAGTLQLLSGARVPIRFVSPAPRIDPKNQGVGFLYIASAESGVLPGMQALAFLPDGTTAPMATVPAAAVVWWQGRAWVYVRTSPETFTRREIPTTRPAPDGGGGYLVSNLPAAAQLVTRGAQALLSEEFRAQIEVGD